MCNKLVIHVNQIDVEVAIMQDGGDDGGDVLRRVGKACRTLAKSHSMNGCMSFRSHICAHAGRGFNLQCVFFQQDQSVELQEAIGTFSEYFQKLEHAMCLLNHPGESLVLQTDFLYMVERVDICIESLKSHVSYDYYFVQPPTHLASPACWTTKKQKYTFCRSSNVYFVGSLQALTQDVSQQLFEQVPFSLRTRPSLAPFPHIGCFQHCANASSLHTIYHGSWTTRTTSWGFRAPHLHAPQGTRGSAFRVPCHIFWRSQKPTELDLMRTEQVELVHIFSSRCVSRSRVVI